MNQIALDQIKQAAFDDELEKIARGTLYDTILKYPSSGAVEPRTIEMRTESGQKGRKSANIASAILGGLSGAGALGLALKKGINPLKSSGIAAAAAAGGAIPGFLMRRSAEKKEKEQIWKILRSDRATGLLSSVERTIQENPSQHGVLIPDDEGKIPRLPDSLFLSKKAAFDDELEKIALGSGGYYQDKNKKVYSYRMETAPFRGGKKNTSYGPDHRGRWTYESNSEVDPKSAEYAKALEVIKKRDTGVGSINKNMRRRSTILKGVGGATIIGGGALLSAKLMKKGR